MQVFEYIQNAEFFIKQQLNNDFSDGHDIAHTVRVVKNCRRLCEQIPHADSDIVILAAWLHDVARPLESQSNGQIDHAAKGSEIAAEFLLDSKLDHAIVQRVARCIAEHRFRSGIQPSSIEAEILYDADKLDSLGAVGIARAMFFAARCGASLHNSREEALQSQPYSCGDTAYREYLVKLSKLPERLFTEPARIIARERAAFMKSFFDQLNSEFFQ